MYSVDQAARCLAKDALYGISQISLACLAIHLSCTLCVFAYLLKFHQTLYDDGDGDETTIRKLCVFLML